MSAYVEAFSLLPGVNETIMFEFDVELELENKFLTPLNMPGCLVSPMSWLRISKLATGDPPTIDNLAFYLAADAVDIGVLAQPQVYSSV